MIYMFLKISINLITSKSDILKSFIKNEDEWI